jgi:hypothetical protein
VTSNVETSRGKILAAIHDAELTEKEIEKIQLELRDLHVAEFEKVVGKESEILALLKKSYK